jgi:hypothetical protein
MQNLPLLRQQRSRNFVINTEKLEINRTKHVNDYINLESFFFFKY